LSGIRTIQKLKNKQNITNIWDKITMSPVTYFSLLDLIIQSSNMITDVVEKVLLMTVLKEKGSPAWKH